MVENKFKNIETNVNDNKVYDELFIQECLIKKRK